MKSFLDNTIKGIPYRDLLKEEAEKIAQDDIVGVSAELAYRFFLALLPLTMFVGAAGALIAESFGLQNPSELLVNAISEQMPEDVADTLEQQLAEAMEAPGLAIMAGTLFAALLAGTGGMNALIKALNRVYQVDESRQFWKRYAIAASMSVIGALFLFTAMGVFVTAGYYGDEVVEALGLPAALGYLLAVLRWPLTFLILTAMVGFLYRMAPARRLSFRWASLGAVAFAVTWLVSTSLFLLYVSNFADYGNTYGVLAGIAILLIWLYVTLMAMVAGAEANAIVDRRTGQRATETPAGDTRRRDRAIAEDRKP